MSCKKNEKQVFDLQVTDNLSVTIIPNSEHEFVMPTKEVAYGYKVATSTIRDHRSNNPDEFIEGKHFVRAVGISDSKHKVPHNKVFWTKRGIVRLGFFIKSERAKLFRDWAEDLVISASLNNQSSPVNKQLPAKRKHNRITPERLADMLADVCMIDDKELRISLTNKLTGRA